MRRVRTWGSERPWRSPCSRGWAAGYWLDGRLGTRPWFLLGGGTLAVVAALVYFFRAVTDLWKRQKDTRR